MVQRLIFLHILILKYPPQNQCNTRVCHRIDSLVFFSQIVLFRVLLFNPTIENEKATNK